MSFISRLFSRKATLPDILNAGLRMAMAFGTDWLQSISKRLAKKYPLLTPQELSGFDATCRNAMKEGHTFIYDMLMKLCNSQQTIKAAALKAAFTGFILEKYPWISKGNLKALYNQGRYYAWKDGWDSCIK